MVYFLCVSLNSNGPNGPNDPNGPKSPNGPNGHEMGANCPGLSHPNLSSGQILQISSIVLGALRQEWLHYWLLEADENDIPQMTANDR